MLSNYEEITTKLFVGCFVVVVVVINTVEGARISKGPIGPLKF